MVRVHIDQLWPVQTYWQYLAILFLPSIVQGMKYPVTWMGYPHRNGKCRQFHRHTHTHTHSHTCTLGWRLTSVRLYIPHVCRQEPWDAISQFSGSLPFLIRELSMGWSLSTFPRWSETTWDGHVHPLDFTGRTWPTAAFIWQGRRLWSLTFHSLGRRWWVSHARSDQFAFKSNASSPARFEQIKHHSSSLQSLQWCSKRTRIRVYSAKSPMHFFPGFSFIVASASHMPSIHHFLHQGHQKAQWKPGPRLQLECRVASQNGFRKRRRSHQCGEALYGTPDPHNPGCLVYSTAKTTRFKSGCTMLAPEHKHTSSTGALGAVLSRWGSQPAVTSLRLCPLCWSLTRWNCACFMAMSNLQPDAKDTQMCWLCPTYLLNKRIIQPTMRAVSEAKNDTDYSDYSIDWILMCGGTCFTSRVCWYY